MLTPSGLAQLVLYAVASLPSTWAGAGYVPSVQIPDGTSFKPDDADNIVILGSPNRRRICHGADVDLHARVLRSQDPP